MPLWLIIVISAIILATLICLIYICCVSAKNKRARRDAALQLELELERAEKDAVELPDDLKQRLDYSKKKGGLYDFYSPR